jgi:hypothetical protein
MTVMAGDGFADAPAIALLGCRQPGDPGRMGQGQQRGIQKLHDGLLPSIAWVEFFPDTPERRAAPSRPDWGRMRFLGRRSGVMDGAPEFTRVVTHLGPADLAAVDALIVAGVAASRAEVLRWAVARIREHPAYAQLQERAHEIDELKAQF